jgi:hypothetical protein
MTQDKSRKIHYRKTIINVAGMWTEKPENLYHMELGDLNPILWGFWLDFNSWVISFVL